MSAKFEKVKRHFESGLWTERMVADAVKKSWITAEEYEVITGEKYAG